MATLSLATDLGAGQPMEHVQCACLLGLNLGDDLGLDESERAVVYYVGLLAWVGCHADSYEQAALFGDDIALRAASYEVDFTGLSALGYLARHVGAGKPPLQRALALGSFAVSGWRSVEDWDHTHCVLAGDFALRLRLGQQVYDALQHCFERWDGKGAPAGLTGEQLALSARILQLADTAQASYRLGGSPER